MSLNREKELCQVLVQVLLNFVFYMASASASTVRPPGGWGMISSQGELQLRICCQLVQAVQ